jgi:hypothetical protein
MRCGTCSAVFLGTTTNNTSTHMPAATFKQWARKLRKPFGFLSSPQLTVLSQWSLGAVLARSCGLTHVSTFVSDTIGESFDAARQRLREFYCEAEAKSGRNRRQLDVECLFAPLLRWIVKLWDSRTIVIALDATTLQDRLSILSISVVFGSTAIPVAWRILRQHRKAAWKPHWCELLDKLRGVVPSSWTVIVMSDRGLYARWLFEAITNLGWHPLMRINHTLGALRYRNRRTTLAAFAKRLTRRTTSIRNARVFSARPLFCTLLGMRKPKCRSPWLLVTDLPPEKISADCYALRAWIEHGFKAFKSGCFCWHRSRIKEPERAERIWFVLAIATLYSVSLASDAERHRNEQPCDTLDALVFTDPKTRKPRRLSLAKAGCLRLLVLLLKTGRLPELPKLRPGAPWPIGFVAQPP